MPEPGIVSYGTGRVEVVPDTIVLRLGSEAKAGDPTAALEQAGAAARAIVAALRQAGIDATAIRTEHANVHEVYEQSPQGEPLPATFQASTNLTVRLAVGAGVEAIIDGVAGAAGERFRLHGLSYSLEDPTPWRAEATRRAVAAARAQAAVLADAAGVTLGAVRRVEELSNEGAAPMPRMAMAAERFRSAGPPIEPGVETIVAIVLMDHALA